MILHTSLTERQVRGALARAHAAGLITADVTFTVLSTRGSRTHDRAIEVQLGTPDKYSLPEGYRDQRGKRMRVRRYKNSGNQGAASTCSQSENTYSATWHEWGWLMSWIFSADPTSRFGSQAVYGYGYRDAGDFHDQTGNQFRDLPDVPEWCECLEGVARECQATGRSCAPLMRQVSPPGLSTAQQDLLARLARLSAPSPAARLLAQSRAAWTERTGRTGVNLSQPDNGHARSEQDIAAYVSPALRRAREQEKRSQELLEPWADPIVFGPHYQ